MAWGLKVGTSCGALVTKVLQAPEIPPNIRPLATQRGAAKQGWQGLRGRSGGSAACSWRSGPEQKRLLTWLTKRRKCYIISFLCCRQRSALNGKAGSEVL